MKLTRYILFGFALFAFAQTIQAQVTNQYQTSNGVATGKHVSEQNSDGTYTITLETFATGEQTLVTTSTPVNVVLVLDVSGSMAWPKGSYSQSTKTSYSYNDIVNGNIEYFRKYSTTSDYIEKIYAEEVVVGNQTRYYLYISPDQGTGDDQGTYLTANGATTTGRNNAAYSTSPTAAIVTPTHNRIYEDYSYNRYRPDEYFYQGTSRIKALQDAVGAFIDEIELNDHQDNSGNERAERLHNKISIVQFAGDGNNTSYNDNETIVALQVTEGNVASMKAAVNAMIPKGATEAGEGMRLANIQLANADANANKVVVLFTDGSPSDNYAAITQSRTTKGDRGAVVYTVGVFTSSPGTTSNDYKYLNAVSSNYGSDVSFTVTGYYNQTLNITGTGAMGGDYYKDASGNVDLTAIFQSISQGIGGSEETVGASTQVRDYVTSSFTVPSGTASDATFYTMDIKPDGSGWTNKQTPAGVTLAIGKKTYPDELDADGQPVQRDTVGVTGFDFSADDNWVGLRYPTGSTTGVYAGKKLVIEFKVRANGDATGGTGAATNTSDSGVYIRTADGEYVNVNHYEIPHTNLPLQISIKKDGLRAGESATFEIWRARPLQLKDGSGNPLYYAVDASGKPTSQQTTTVTAYPIWDYNALGKPKPDEDTWKDWSKVIVTNKSGVDGQSVFKTLKALDAGYIYKVTEDNWGWSYTMTGAGGTLTTSEVEVNPFHFTNEEKADAVKHAEAVMINHFQGKDGQTSRTEHAKSSKVERF